MKQENLIHANYHTHTVRCHHAEGSEREYVEEAIKAGLTTLGFADHTPYIFHTKGYYSSFRMRPEELEGYVQVLRALQEEYKDSISILIGLETEHYPALWQDYCKLIKNSGVQYLIMGQHFAAGEPGGKYSGRADDDEERLKSYVDSVIGGAQTGLFSYVAHPDIINFTGDHDLYLAEMERLVQGVVKEGLPLELNILGLREGRSYPREDFLELVGKHHGKMIIGSDAHTPEHVYDHETVRRAVALAEKYGIELTERIDTTRLQRLL